MTLNVVQTLALTFRGFLAGAVLPTPVRSHLDCEKRADFSLFSANRSHFHTLL